MARGRIPKPWLRKSTGQWTVTLDGKQISLGKSKREALSEFAKLLNARGRGPVALLKLTVSQLVDLWLTASARTVRPRTIETYRYYGARFAEFAGGLLITDLKPFHVDQWVNSFQWSQSTRHLAVTICKAMSSWAEAQGYLDRDPLRRMKRPAMQRRAATTLEDFEHLLLRLPPFAARAVLFVRLTGLRPGELCSLRVDTIQLSDIDQSPTQITVSGKTGIRSVPLSQAASILLSSVVGSRTKGAAFLNSYGKPLTLACLSLCVRRHRGKDLRHVVPHGLRGLFGTEALRAGVDALLVAKLLGHADTSMLARHYANLEDQDLLKEAADKASGKKSKDR